MEPAGNALVTGASRGIGRAVALELCARGFDVIATMRDVGAGASLLDDAAGAAGTIEVRRLDVTDAESIEVPEDLRVLINNAGLDRENLPVEEMPLGHWREVFETNVFGLVEVTRRSIPALRATGGGVIVNVTTASLFVPMPFFALYRASKAAVSALGESLRVELAPQGIRVIEVTPGPVETDMLAASSSEPEGSRFAVYRALAQRVGAVRAGIDDHPAPTTLAAAAMVDAVLEEDPPLRVACDPVGAALLESWGAQHHEASLRGMLEVFDPNRPPS